MKYIVELTKHLYGAPRYIKLYAEEANNCYYAHGKVYSTTKDIDAACRFDTDQDALRAFRSWMWHREHNRTTDRYSTHLTHRNDYVIKEMN